MRVSVVAGLIVGVHVAVIGSVVMTQGCASTKSGAGAAVPEQVETAPVPPTPPSADVMAAPALQPVAFPAIQPPVEPAPLKTSVAAENVYVVKSGDSLSKIAAAHGVKAAELKELNQIADVNKIRIGQKLSIESFELKAEGPNSNRSGLDVSRHPNTFAMINVGVMMPYMDWRPQPIHKLLEAAHQLKEETKAASLEELIAKMRTHI